MTATFVNVATALMFVGILFVRAPAAGEEPSGLAKKADSVRATAAEMNFMKMPWVTDVGVAFRLAADETRPVFLYLVTGDPLDDC
jgi:hypothetical protein